MTTPMTEDETKNKMLERVRALLAKAESTDSEHEAELCTAKASELMQRYNIDRAMAEHREHRNVKPTVKVMDVEAPYATAKVVLLGAVARGFRCQVVYNGSGKYVRARIFGFQDDIDMVVILYTSLLLQASSGARRVSDVQETWEGPVVRTRSARRAYILGFSSSVGGRLQAALVEAMRAEEAEHRAKAARARAARESAGGVLQSDDELNEGAALVLAGRAVAVKSFVDESCGKIRTVTQVSRNGRAYNRGYDDGQRANLHNRKATGQGARAALR